MFENLTPGEYEFKASKLGYATSNINSAVGSTETKYVNIPLNGIPIPSFSSAFLDFGFDSTLLSFTISNIGKAKFSYLLTTSDDRISVNPSSGEITNETDTIIVTVNRTGLSEDIFKKMIEVISSDNQVLSKDTVHVYLNGVADREGNYYKLVKIGTQIWMAENLNTGKMVSDHTIQKDNGIVEKYCYNNDKNNCTTYGGLYQWEETMQNHPSDTGLIGTTQGICPDGWHLPTEKELRTLISYLGGEIGNPDEFGTMKISGDIDKKLKEAGTQHWYPPNNATNESGFTALPGGTFNYYYSTFDGKGGSCFI